MYVGLFGLKKNIIRYDKITFKAPPHPMNNTKIFYLEVMKFWNFCPRRSESYPI